MDIKDLIKKVIRYNKNANINLIDKAYKFSDNLLKGKTRASGKPWMDHYLDVASEVADLKLDDIAVTAALMHGILNKGAALGDIEKNFGKEIAGILENIETMSKIKKNVSKSISEFNNLRKVLLAASKDLRALLIKICDKVVNLRELDYLPAGERKRIAKESMELYAPLAYRLGIVRVKSEIEDLAFRYIDEAKFKELEDKVNKIRKEGEKFIFKIKKIIEKILEEERIEGKVQTRVKHLYSIYKKIIDRSYNLNEMTDIIAIRVIVNDIDDCYKVLRVIHGNFRPIPNKFKDYIAMPKPNGYQSLHTAVVDSEGKIFEVQIRTYEMHDGAEEGIAAHLVIKKISHEKEFDKKLSWLKQLVEDKEALGSFDIDFFGDEVFAFTPKGKVIELPKNSTVVDFAYHVHSDLGDHCLGANINGKFVPLKEEIENGDVIEVLTSKTHTPNRDWLKIASTAKARTKIKHFLKEAGKISTRIYSVQTEVRKEAGENLLHFEGDKRIKIKLALCCKPIPGDGIIGVKTSNIKMNVHKTECKDIIKTSKKKIKVGWMEKFKKPVRIIIDAKDRSGLFKEIMNSVNKLGIIITGAKGKMIGEDNVECTFTADVGSLNKLNEIINRINKIKNVKKVYVTI